MLPRILEPEVMDTADDARDYDTMDHSTVNRVFVDDFLAAHPDVRGPILDVGTGTAQIPIELVSRRRGHTLVAIDLAEAMLILAQTNVTTAGFQDQIELRRLNASQSGLPDAGFAAVISNSIIHHIPDPSGCFAEMVRVCRPGGGLFVRDLFRPSSKRELEELVATYAGEANPHQRQLFADSLHAALTVDEMRDLVSRLGFSRETVSATSDRHWTFSAVKP
jgi:ubiquinone/menaquinone biosynthesis C-methylase UbiE